MNRKFVCMYIITVLAVICLCGCARYQAEMSYTIDAPDVVTASLEIPKAIVVYDSWSGNTKLIAEAMAKEMKCPAVQVKNVSEFNMADYDLIVIGSPVHGGMPTGEVDQFLTDLETPRASAVFVTFGAPLFGPFTANRCLNSMAEKLHETCIGRFKCHGFHHLFRTYSDHPDEIDKTDAEKFAAGLLERCRKLTQPEAGPAQPVNNKTD